MRMRVNRLNEARSYSNSDTDDRKNSHSLTSPPDTLAESIANNTSAAPTVDESVDFVALLASIFTLFAFAGCCLALWICTQVVNKKVHTKPVR